MVQVAFWAFPQDASIVHAYSNMTDSSKRSWPRAEDIVRTNQVSDIWQVGQ